MGVAGHVQVLVHHDVAPAVRPAAYVHGNADGGGVTGGVLDVHAHDGILTAHALGAKADGVDAVFQQLFHSVCIGRDHFVAAVDPAHPLAGRQAVTLEELAAQPLVMYNTDSVQNHSIRSRFDRLGVVPNILIYTSQIYTMKSMIHNNTCVSFFFDSILQDHPDIVGVPIEPQIEQKVGLIWRKGKYTPKSVEAFISFVRDYPLFPEEP